MSETSKAKEKDHSRRHRFLFALLRPIGFLIARLKFGYTFERMPKLNERFILLSNHVTDFDPILVGLALRGQAYFVASEHISRWKVFPILKFIFDPILRYKGTVGAYTVRDMLKRIKEGKNLAFFPEGVRTFDGVTCPILPSTGRLIKRSGSALVTYKLQGGYFCSPNWGEKNFRKGYFHGSVVHVVSSAELKAMSEEEVNRLICDDLYEDAYATQARLRKKYKGKNLAERLENVLFICPKCQGRLTMHSSGSKVTCAHCGFSSEYNEYGDLTGPYRTVRDWAVWEREVLKEMAEHGEALESPSAVLYNVHDGAETLVSEGKVSLGAGVLRVGDVSMPLSEISDMEIHGQHEVVFPRGKEYHELHIEDGVGALPFLWLFKAYKQL